MQKKISRKIFVRSKKTRLALSVIILFAVLLIYEVKSILLSTGPGTTYLLIPLVLVVLLFLCFPIILGILFSDRYPGMFQRFDMEMDNISSGNQNELYMRENDNPHLKSFISKVNKALNQSKKTPGSETEQVKGTDNNQ